MSADPTERLREICLALPEATERETWEAPTFRILDKIFAMPRSRDGHPSVWCKAASGVQQTLIGSDPTHYFFPPYVGPKGWIGIRLDGDLPWEDIADHIHESYRLIAPKRLVALLDTEHATDPGDPR
jgi:predicted DNA-binding protein (MmcQ/YjbR family)